MFNVEQISRNNCKNNTSTSADKRSFNYREYSMNKLQDDLLASEMVKKGLLKAIEILETSRVFKKTVHKGRC